MSPNRAIAFTTLLSLALGGMLVAPCAHAAHADSERRPSRHFDLVNATFDSITALAIAPADSEAFHNIALDQPLQGGLNSITFDVPAGGCLRDIRATFHGQRSRLFQHVDVCRSSGLRLTPQKSMSSKRAGARQASSSAADMQPPDRRSK